MQSKVEALNLPPTVEHALLTQIIPALSLERVAALIKIPATWARRVRSQAILA